MFGLVSSLVGIGASMLGKGGSSTARELARRASDQRDMADSAIADAAQSADDRFAAESQFLDTQQGRWDNIYSPLEQSIAADLGQGPQTEQAAAIAGSNFAGNYDANLAARNRAQQRQGVNFRPGSSASQMQTNNDAYARAAGISTAETQARREEDDAHFLKSTAFFNSNANSVQNRLQSGLATMYGADYASNLGIADAYNQQAGTNQNYSTALNQESNAGIGAIADLAGSFLGGGGGEAIGGAIAGGIGNLFSQ